MVPEVLFSVVNVETPVMLKPVLEVFPVFKTVCKFGLEAVPVK
jgi:hypothetical protein